MPIKRLPPRTIANRESVKIPIRNVKLDPRVKRSAKNAQNGKVLKIVKHLRDIGVEMDEESWNKTELALKYYRKKGLL